MLSSLVKKFPLFFLLVFALLVFLPLPALAVIHTVSPGDTLYSLSLRYGSTVDVIKEVNGLRSEIIYPGQKIYIPKNYNQGGTVSYTVRPNDTLYLIGSSFGVNYLDIMSVNGLTTTTIYPGQVLLIPGQLPASGGTGSLPASRGGVFAGRIPYTRADFDLLARIITAEADSESFLTKVAVGAVVLNRVLSPLFPDTIQGVVYQVDEVGAYQFEPVLNGWINVPASEESRRAAQVALKGADPTEGALFFFESWVTNSFLRSRPLSIILDSFTFTY
ncbi:MAG: LysM peptidoglycan-binding domain-containing protein [Desulfotomaculales bacterium]